MHMLFSFAKDKSLFCACNECSSSLGGANTNGGYYRAIIFCAYYNEGVSKFLQGIDEHRGELMEVPRVKVLNGKRKVK